MKLVNQLDKEGVLALAQNLQAIGSAIVTQDATLRADVAALRSLVSEAMLFECAQNTIWFDEAKALHQSFERRRIDQENNRFAEKHGHFLPQPILPEPVIAASLFQAKDKHEMAKIEQELNTVEAGFGEEMTEEQLAEHFKESAPAPVRTDRLKKPLNKMSIQEIEAWEEEQNNATDIYKISARVMNLARGDSGKSLGQNQTMLCNTFCHVLKAFYDFADRIPDKDLKIKLQKLVRSQENMPANLIAAAVSQVQGNK